MRLSYGCAVWEKQVYFDDLPVSRRAIADAVVVQTKFAADGVQLLANLSARGWIRVVEQADSGAPRQPSSRPENIYCHSDRNDRIERLPSGQHHQPEPCHHAEAGE